MSHRLLKTVRQRGRDGRATGGERIRYTNMKHPERYCEAVESGTKLWCEEEVIGSREREIERLMLGIRLNEGVEADGVDPVASQKLQARGWLIQTGARLKLTPEGRHFCSEVTAALI